MGEEGKRFDQVTFAALETSVKELAARVPEIEGVAFTVLWRFPDQSNIPSSQLVGARGPVCNPDQLARLGIVTTRFQHWIVEQYGEALVMLRTVESQLTELVNEKRQALAQISAQQQALRQENTPLSGHEASTEN